MVAASFFSRVATQTAVPGISCLACKESINRSPFCMAFLKVTLTCYILADLFIGRPAAAYTSLLYRWGALHFPAPAYRL